MTESRNLATKNLDVIVTASLAGLLFGFDTVVMSGVTQSLRDVFHLEPGSWWFGFAVASALFGTTLGALFAGIPGDAFGSRDSLKAVGFLYVVSARRQRVVLEPAVVLRVPLHRRPGHRRFVGARAGVHLGNRSGESPRRAHRAFPVQHRVRHPAGVRQQFRRAVDSRRLRRLALEARRGRGAGVPVSAADVHDSAEPALAQLARA